MDRFKLMETFIAVVGFQSYTKAAKELGVTRGLVSKRIRDLELIVKTRLLNRNTQHLSLTEAGSDYYKSCVSLLTDLRAAEDDLLTRRSAVSGEIKILSSKTFGETILAPIIADFCRDNPEIMVTIIIKDMGPDENDLISRGFDIAIRTQSVEDTTLVARAIVSLPRVLVATPGYLKRHGTPLVPEDLLGHKCLNPDHNGAKSYDWVFTGLGGKSVVRVSGTLGGNSSSIIRHAAHREIGIAMLNRYVVAEDLQRGSLVTVLDNYTATARKLYVIYPKDRYQPQRLKVFINFFSSRIKKLSKLM